MIFALPHAHAPHLLIDRDTFVRGFIWLAISSSAVVLTEPAPADVLMLALMALLPIAGMQFYKPSHAWVLALWLACGTGALIASSLASDGGRASVHAGVSIYLYFCSFSLAAFVAVDPKRHASLLFSGLVAGAFVAATAGIVGYVEAVPGAFELFTKFGRAAGTFKDPNVFGPFLIPAILYLVHRTMDHGPRSTALSLALLGVLCLAMLLCFSRGAWFNMMVSFGVYVYLSLVCAFSNRSRSRLVLFSMLVPALTLLASALLLQVDSLAALFDERSHLANSYDVGPDGRFGGHLKAMGLILLHPLGIGALEFAGSYHHEDVHNVYLSMFLNAGWLGGVMYLAVVGLTLTLGARRALMRFPGHGLFIIAYASFFGNVLEGWIVDTDHWRHFYLLLAILWGLMPEPARRLGVQHHRLRPIARAG
jgi:hypothetical protein